MRLQREGFKHSIKTRLEGLPGSLVTGFLSVSFVPRDRHIVGKTICIFPRMDGTLEGVRSIVVEFFEGRSVVDFDTGDKLKLLNCRVVQKDERQIRESGLDLANSDPCIRVAGNHSAGDLFKQSACEHEKSDFAAERVALDPSILSYRLALQSRRFIDVLPEEDSGAVERSGSLRTRGSPPPPNPRSRRATTIMWTGFRASGLFLFSLK